MKYSSQVSLLIQQLEEDASSYGVKVDVLKDLFAHNLPRPGDAGDIISATFEVIADCADLYDMLVDRAPTTISAYTWCVVTWHLRNADTEVILNVHQVVRDLWVLNDFCAQQRRGKTPHISSAQAVPKTDTSATPSAVSISLPF